ncbi:MAG: flagellar biosynthetic protein FliR [Phycisphaerales bacterium]|nr:flagellar biosynthetic protein FliR [Phycisphaerales bacterium]
MQGIDSIAVHIVPFLLVVTRLTGIFLLTPLLRSTSVPMMFRALLAVMFALAIFPFLPPTNPGMAVNLVELVPLMFAELLIGAAIGLVAGLPLIALEMGGYVIGYQIGLSMAESFNPELDTNGSVIGQLLFYLGIFLFISVGGLDILFMALADSYHTVPLGTFTATDAPLGVIVGVLSSGFELAIRIASPIIAVVGLLYVSMGFIMKTMPQINIMSIGFAAQIMAGLITMALLIGTVSVVAGEEIEHTLAVLVDWVHGFASAGVLHG